MDFFLENVWPLWAAGGVLMVPLSLLAAFIYYTAFQLYFHFNKGNYLRVDFSTLDKWVKEPKQAKGEIGEIVNYTQADLSGMPDLRNRFAEVRSVYLPPVDRRIMFLSVLVSVAPLMGLLGTVMGMLATFEGLTKNIGRTIDLIAAGISEALITTQTGLIIAIPGYVMIYMVMRKRNKMETVLHRLESMTMQRYSTLFGKS
ncbi:MAG: MotA/TolQ/ExbB proton channel family protein [Opitutales bacterium]